MSFLNTKIEEYISNTLEPEETEIVFECDELDKYDFPCDAFLPEGEYYSIIMGLREYKDRFSKQYIDVCYKVFSKKQKALWENNKIERIYYYYIRQRILRGSDDERKFRCAMGWIVGKETFTANDLVGVSEYLKIYYYDQDPNGTITYREWSELQPIWFIDDTSEEFHQKLETDLEITP